MFLFLLIVENLESSEIFKAAAKKSTPGVQVFHQTHLSASVSLEISSDQSFTEFLLWAWACTRHRGYSPFPQAMPSLAGQRQGQRWKDHRECPTVDCQAFSKDNSKEQAFIKNLKQKIGLIPLRVIGRMRMWIMKMQNNTGNQPAGCSSPSSSNVKGPELCPQGFGVQFYLPEETGHQTVGQFLALRN